MLESKRDRKEEGHIQIHLIDQLFDNNMSIKEVNDYGISFISCSYPWSCVSYIGKWSNTYNLYASLLYTSMVGVDIQLLIRTTLISGNLCDCKVGPGSSELLSFSDLERSTRSQVMISNYLPGFRDWLQLFVLLDSLIAKCWSLFSILKCSIKTFNYTGWY